MNNIAQTNHAHRMQRILHSILSARILLNLRQAAYRDRARAPTSSATGTMPNFTEASVAIGMDTWFQSSGATSTIQDMSIEMVQPDSAEA